MNNYSGQNKMTVHFLIMLLFFSQDSLVMHRPDKNHQWLFNKNSFPIVDVVIDPYLVHHLRPHQKEGIMFLYECVMGMR